MTGSKMITVADVQSVQMSIFKVVGVMSETKEEIVSAVEGYSDVEYPPNICIADTLNVDTIPENGISVSEEYNFKVTIPNYTGNDGKLFTPFPQNDTLYKIVFRFAPTSTDLQIDDLVLYGKTMSSPY
jgi:hypothetical protein